MSVTYAGTERGVFTNATRVRISTLVNSSSTHREMWLGPITLSANAWARVRYDLAPIAIDGTRVASLRVRANARVVRVRGLLIFEEVLPTPYCRVLGPPPHVGDALLHDPLGGTFMLHARLALASRACQPVAKLALWHPCDAACARDPLRRYDGGVARTDAVHWWTVRVPQTLTFVGAPWVRAESPRHAGLIVARGRVDPPSASNAGDASLDEARRELLRATRRDRQLLCYANADSTRLECGSGARIEGGTTLTMIAFVRGGPASTPHEASVFVHALPPSPWPFRGSVRGVTFDAHPSGYSFGRWVVRATPFDGPHLDRVRIGTLASDGI